MQIGVFNPCVRIFDLYHCASISGRNGFVRGFGTLEISSVVRSHVWIDLAHPVHPRHRRQTQPDNDLGESWSVRPDQSSIYYGSPYCRRAASRSGARLVLGVSCLGSRFLSIFNEAKINRSRTLLLSKLGTLKCVLNNMFLPIYNKVNQN